MTGVDRKAVSVSSNSIRQEGQKSQEVFSACYFLRINIGHPFETKIGMTVLCFRKTVHLCHCEERSDAASAVCCDVENTKTRTQLNRNGTKCVRVVGTPEGTRTPDLLIRSQSLYPTELLAHTHFSQMPEYSTTSLKKMQVLFSLFPTFLSSPPRRLDSFGVSGVKCPP